MQIIVRTSSGSATVAPAVGGVFTGLATGMFIDPCIVFPNGATITDIQVAASESFTASAYAAQESHLYSLNVREIEVVSFGFVATSSLVARIGEVDDATVVSLGVSAVSSVVCLIEGLEGMCVVFGITSVSELKCASLLSSTRAAELGFESTHKLTCAANLQVTRAVELGFESAPSLRCKASLKVTWAVSLSFARSHPLTANAELTIPKMVSLVVWTYRYYPDPIIRRDTSSRAPSLPDNRWVFSDRMGIEPYESPLNRRDSPIRLSIIMPVASLTIT